MPPELEQTLALLSARRNVLGYLLISRPAHAEPASIIRQAGVIFEGEAGRRYARAVVRIVDAVREGLEDIGREHDDVVSGHSHFWYLRGFNLYPWR